MSLANEFISTVIRRLKYYKDLGDKTFDQLEEADFRFQPNNESNSIAIIIHHMAGNMLSRWTNFLEEDGEKSWRTRDAEFTAQDFTREQLIHLWEEGWKCFFEAIQSLTKTQLKQTITIREEPLTVMDAINRQMAHYPYHIGQIIYIAKILKDKSWKNLSIPRGASQLYNNANGVKDPAKKFS